jgi:hypothetical protein
VYIHDTQKLAQEFGESAEGRHLKQEMSIPAGKTAPKIPRNEQKEEK